MTSLFVALILAATWTPVGTGGVNLKAAQHETTIEAPVVYDDDPPTKERGHVNALAVFKGELYAAGLFDTAGGIAAHNIARWDGTRWSAVGDGLEEGVVTSLLVYRDELYVGGYWKKAGGKPIANLAKWDGKAWSAVGTGVDGDVAAMTIFKDELVVAGGLEHAGGVAANHVARWNGKTWSALKKGVPNDPYALGVFRGELYAGGTFLDASKDLDNLYKWNGERWAGAGSFDGGVSGLLGTEKLLYVQGSFTHERKTETGAVAQTDGKKWSSTGGGLAWPQGHSKDHVAVLSMIDGVLHAGGHLPKAGAVEFGGAASWNGKTWSPVADGLIGDVQAFAQYKGELYVGGDFALTGSGVEGVSNMARMKPDAPAQANVGVATMSADGTINLQLRSVDHGMVAEALKVVHPGDADYKSTLEHLGGLKPGESKPIPPWADK